MNYDRNGVLVTTSRPKPVLRKAYRTITVDSRDRDPTKYVKVNGGASSSDPGDYVVYFPRPFQKVTRIRLMNAALLGVQPADTYIMMQIEGLNRIDECAAGADRAGYVDSAFAKILNDRPVVATGAAYTYATIVAIGNRAFYQANPTISGAVSVASSNTNGTTVTYNMGTASTGGAPPVGSWITVPATLNPSALQGTFQVLSSTSTTFTVFNSATAPTAGSGNSSGNIAYSTVNPSPLLSGITTNGTNMTVTFSTSHNILSGESITISGLTGGISPTTVTGYVTSVTSTNQLVFNVTTPFTGVATGITSGIGTAGSVLTVNNLQYAYVTTITTSFVAGQYLVINGLSNTGANAAAQILQSSLSTGTTGTFETTNVNAGPVTLNNSAGTAIISQAIYYNDMSYAPNITYYNPPIGTLDRMHITLRRHLPLSSVTSTNPTNAPIIFGPAENTFTFEIEYIDNVFEDVSTFETRLDNADYTPKFQV